LVASILAQYLRHHGMEIHCIDSDPVNQTFSQYAELGAEHLALMRDGRIDSGGFDIFLHRLLTEEGTFIVDNGASTFVPLRSFIVESNALEMLSDAGRKLYVHTIICRRQSSISNPETGGGGGFARPLPFVPSGHDYLRAQHRTPVWRYFQPAMERGGF
jgi:hypothetical protein